MAGWGSELTQGEVAAIDVAVRVTGQQAVQELQANLNRVRQEIDFQKAAYQGGAQSVAEFTKEIQKLNAEQAKLEALINRGSNELKNFNKQIQVGGPGMLQFAYALDDIQYGFSAIVNNIPGIVQALGGTQGVAGAVGTVVVGLNILNSALKASGVDVGKFAQQAGKDFLRARDVISDPIRDAADNLKGLGEVIDALNDKPLKTDEDYRALRKLTEESEKATRALREWEMLKNKRSSFDQEAVEQVQKAVVEGGGARNVEDALIEIAKRNGTFAAGSTLHGEIAVQQGIVDQNKGSYGDLGPLGIIARARSDAATAQIATLKEQMEKDGRDQIAQMMALGQGEGSRKTLEGLVEDPRNADVFAKHQIDLLNLQAGVAGAAPDRLFETERNKHAREAAKKAQDRQAAADRQAEIEQEKAEREKNRDIEAEAREGAADRRLEDQIRAKNAREAAAAERQAKAGAMRNEREAPRVAKHARQMGFAQDFQARTGATDAEANYAGKQIGNLVDKGANPQVAAQQVYDQMMRVILKQQANMDMLTGVNSGAIQQLRMLDAQADNLRQRIRGVGGNQRRMNNQRPTRGIPF